jgi:PAS domain S-box-containing protein
MSGRGHLELNLLDQVPLALVIATVDGRIRYWNKGAEELCGWQRRDVVRRPLAALAASLRVAGVLQEALEAVASGGLWEGRVSFRHRHGGVVATKARCSPLLNAGAGTIGVILVAVEASPARRGDEGGGAHVGRRIAQARKEAGLTQQELADRVGVTRRSVQGYESGAIAPYRHLDRLAEVLGRSREWLVSDGTGDVPAELKAELRDLIREELLETLGQAAVA